MNRQKRIASVTIYDYYGDQQVRNAEFLGPKPPRCIDMFVINTNNNPLYLKLFRRIMSMLHQL